MVRILPDLKRFAARPAGLGRCYAHKSALALVSKGSRRLGVNVKTMSATFVVTTDDPDRVDDVVVSKGLYTGNFKNNPVGFYGHQSIILPIGKWETPGGRLCVWPEDGQTTGTIYFSQKTADAAQVFALVEEGILRATSIGFNPLEEPIPRGPREKNPNSIQTGFRFPRVDLLEISIVGIPAQPTATLVREVLSRNRLAGGVILEPIRKSLEPLSEARPAWSNGATLPQEQDMSKKWGKTTPKKAPAPVSGRLMPPGSLKKLLEWIPAEFKSALQDCVSQKIPKLIDEGYSDEQAQAIAFSQCGEKDLAGSTGAAGGYTVPPDKDKDKKTALVAAKWHAVQLAAAAVIAKQPPPPARTDDAPQNPDQQLPDDGPPEPGSGKADPKAVLAALVDSIADYIDLTTKPAPTQAPAQGMGGGNAGNDEGGYGLDADVNTDAERGDFPDQQEDDEDEEDDEKQGMDRYNFRSVKPHEKAYKLCKACMKKLCKGCKDMVGADDDGEDADDTEAISGADDGESNDPNLAPVNKGDDLDLGAILRALRPVSERAAAVSNAWADLQGTMP